MASQAAQSAQTSRAKTGDGSVERFVRWAVAQLDLDLIERPDGACELIRREETPDGPAVEQVSVFRWSGATAPTTVDGRAIEAATCDSRLFQRLCDSLGLQDTAVHTRPKQQPSSVHDVSSQLFLAYTVAGGSVHLGGCNLEDRPFLRLSYAVIENDRVEHHYFAQDGSRVSEELVAALGLNEILPVGPFPPRIDESQVELLVSAGRRHVESDATVPANDNGPRYATKAGKPIAVAIVWAKYVTGKLQFSIGDATAWLPFAGWARTLAAPPFHCEASKTDTFHVGSTDDGRVVAEEEIAVCEKSGRRAVRCELVKCSVTGRHVLSEFVKNCPVSGKPAIIEEFTPCKRCRQEVSNAVLKDGICQACRNMAAVSVDDPRIVWLLGEYPKLNRFRKWRLAETTAVYIAQAATMWKRCLFVVDKETFHVHRVIIRAAISSKWIDAEPTEREELLGS